MPTNRTKRTRNKKPAKIDKLPPDVLFKLRYGYSVEAPFTDGDYGWFKGRPKLTSDPYDDIFFAFLDEKIPLLERLLREHKTEIYNGLAEGEEPFIIEWIEDLKQGRFY